MSYKQNLHIHSIYCDGADTPEEMVITAIEKGFDSIGFSGHSYTSFAPVHSMGAEKEKEYKQVVNQLKNKYANDIKIFCGLEYDIHSDVDVSGYDYIIGSVHYFKIDGKYVSFDRAAEKVSNVIKEYFDGAGMKYAKAYYASLADLPKHGRFDIIGHFDLITKHCETNDFFDINSDEYIKYAIEAAEALAGEIPLFEVNTGAIARGYRTTPYPSPVILRELKRLGFGAVITSDCHNRNYLDCGYEQAAELLKHCGFNEKYILTENGFVTCDI